MREIKFRSWCKHCNKMSKPITLQKIIELSHTDEHTPHETWMQYTGLKDKNGKEIYEGDICKTKSSRIISIVWNDELLRWDMKVVKRGHYEALAFMSLEIIGNIYENKELLKEGGKI